MDKEIIQRQLIHTCHFRNKISDDIVVIKEKLRLKNNSIIPNIRIIKNPLRTFYVTKPAYRNHKHKKAYETIDKLDKIVCRNNELEYKLKKALGKHNRSNKLYNLLNNPYVYGADISLEVLIKIRYELENKNKSIPLDIGYFDIEVSMMEKNYLDDNEVICVSFSHKDTIYTGFLKYLMFQEDPRTKRIVPFTLEELKAKSSTVIENELSKLPKEYKFKYEYFIAKSEKDLLKWTFDTINKNNTDFLGIWNMKFDIPHILKRMNKLGMNQKEIICNDEIPDDCRYLYYYEDKTPVSHFSLKWDWFYSTSGTQFIDGLGLYSLLRKTSGYESSYKLDDILKKNINLRKLSLGKDESHRIMQSRHFLDYIIYNQFDVIGPHIMELNNQDILQMYKRCGVNTLDKFNRMNLFLKNNFYSFFLKKGRVIASIGSKYTVPFEDKFWSCDCGRLTGQQFKGRLCEVCETKVISKLGGAVLQPSRCVGVGLNMRNDMIFET